MYNHLQSVVLRLWSAMQWKRLFDQELRRIERAYGNQYDCHGEDKDYVTYVQSYQDSCDLELSPRYICRRNHVHFLRFVVLDGCRGRGPLIDQFVSRHCDWISHGWQTI
jgi:hypothetical protein